MILAFVGKPVLYEPGTGKQPMAGTIVQVIDGNTVHIAAYHVDGQRWQLHGSVPILGESTTGEFWTPLPK